MSDEIPVYKEPGENNYKERFNNNRFKFAILMMTTLNTALDEGTFTPGRDFQVFGHKDFSHLFGANHFYGDAFGLIFSLIGAIPYIAKIFNKNETNELDGLVKNLKKEIGCDIELANEATKKAIEQRFNEMLKKRQLDHYLEARIEKNKKGKLDLTFHYKPRSYIKKILNGEEWNNYKNENFIGLSQKLLPEIFEKKAKDVISDAKAKLLAELTVEEPRKINLLPDANASFAQAIELLKQKIHQEPAYYKSNQDFCDRLLTYAEIYPAFYDEKKKVFVERSTFEQCRLHALERLNNYNILDNLYEFLFNGSLWFWVCYYPADMIQDQDNTSTWSPKAILTVLGVGVLVTLAQAGLSLANYVKNKFSKSELEKSDNQTEITNKPLKQQLLEEYCIEEVSKDRLEKAGHEDNLIVISPCANSKITELLNAANPSEVAIIPEFRNKAFTEAELKRINKKSTAYKTAKQLAHLETEAHTEFRKQNSFKRLFAFAGNIIGRGIGLGLIGWWVGVALTALGVVVVGALLLTNPVGIALFGIGMAWGAYQAYKTVKKEKAAEIELQNVLENNKDKIAHLKKLEVQNRKLEGFIVAHGKTPLKVYKSHDDRAARRLTTVKANWWTNTKKALNRTAVTIGRAGTGILIVRLLVLPALLIAGASLAVITGPIGLGIALGLGLIWAAAHVYKYHKESKLKAARRTLDDIDNRIKVEEENQKVLLKQLNYRAGPAASGQLNNSQQPSGEQPNANKTASLKSERANTSNLLFFKDPTKAIIEQIKKLGEAVQNSETDSAKMDECVFAARDLKKLLVNNQVNIRDFRDNFTTKVDFELYDQACDWMEPIDDAQAIIKQIKKLGTFVQEGEKKLCDLSARKLERLLVNNKLSIKDFGKNFTTKKDFKLYQQACDWFKPMEEGENETKSPASKYINIR